MALSIDFWKSVKSLFLIYLTWGLYIFYKKLYRKQNLFFKENKSDDIIIDEINSINDNMTTEYDDVNSMIYKLLHENSKDDNEWEDDSEWTINGSKDNELSNENSSMIKPHEINLPEMEWKDIQFTDPPTTERKKDSSRKLLSNGASIFGAITGAVRTARNLSERYSSGETYNHRDSRNNYNWICTGCWTTTISSNVPQGIPGPSNHIHYFSNVGPVGPVRWVCTNCRAELWLRNDVNPDVAVLCGCTHKGKHEILYNYSAHGVVHYWKRMN